MLPLPYSSSNCIFRDKKWFTDGIYEISGFFLAEWATPLDEQVYFIISLLEPLITMCVEEWNTYSKYRHDIFIIYNWFPLCTRLSWMSFNLYNVHCLMFMSFCLLYRDTVFFKFFIFIWVKKCTSIYNNTHVAYYIILWDTRESEANTPTQRATTTTTKRVWKLQ